MNPETQKIIERVRKMLNLANDAGAAEGERDNAMRMAHNLMLKFNIDASQLEATGRAQKEARIEKGLEFYGRPWARNVAYNVARLFFCSYLTRSKYRSKEAVHLFIGRESNAITASEIARFAVESIMREGKRKQRAAGGDNDWFRSFCWGAANSINRRVSQMLAEATGQHVPGSSMALVVYRNEDSENQSFIDQRYPKLRKSRSGKGIGSFEGRQQGTEYGKSVSLNRQLGGKS
jgi:hypothetical protein